jgi:hypothetical protein
MRSEFAAVDRKRTLVEVGEIAEFVLQAFDHSHPKQRIRDRDVIRAESAFADRDRPTQRFLGAIRMLVGEIDLRDADETAGNVG